MVPFRNREDDYALWEELGVEMRWDCLGLIRSFFIVALGTATCMYVTISSTSHMM
jgi:hypothetical protein